MNVRMIAAGRRTGKAEGIYPAPGSTRPVMAGWRVTGAILSVAFTFLAPPVAAVFADGFALVATGEEARGEPCRDEAWIASLYQELDPLDGSVVCSEYAQAGVVSMGSRGQVTVSVSVDGGFDGASAAAEARCGSSGYAVFRGAPQGGGTQFHLIATLSGTGEFDHSGTVYGWGGFAGYQMTGLPHSWVSDTTAVADIWTHSQVVGVGFEVAARAELIAAPGGSATALAQASCGLTVRTETVGADVSFVPAPDPIALGSGHAAPSLATATQAEWGQQDKPTYIIAHGWKSSSESTWITETVNAIRDADPDAKILLVDWSAGSGADADKGPVSAFRSRNNATIYGTHAGTLVVEAIRDFNLDPSKMVLVGHSHGGAVVDAIGKTVAGAGLGRLGEAVLLDMPQYGPKGAMVHNFDADNYIHVTNLIAETELRGHLWEAGPVGVGTIIKDIGYGAEVSGTNVANIAINKDNLRNSVQPYEGVHADIARYLPVIISENPVSPILQGLTDHPLVGSFRETGVGFVEGAPVRGSGVELEPHGDGPRIDDDILINVGPSSLGEWQGYLFLPMSPAILSSEVTIPEDADLLRFSFIALDAMIGGTLVVEFEEEVLGQYELTPDFVGQVFDSGLLDLGNVRGRHGRLTFLVDTVFDPSLSVFVGEPEYIRIVPEPTSLCLMVVAGLLAVRRPLRRRPS